MPTVIIPPPYRGPTKGESEVIVEAGDVRACIHAVDAQYPGFASQVFDASGGMHRFVKLFLNGEPILAAQLSAAVNGKDALEVVAAISGGA